MKSLKVFLLSFIFVFAIGFVATTENVTAEEVKEAATKAVNLDEDIQPEDLEISEPRLLPDSPFYFLKNWARGIQSILTFNPVRKAELKMKFANEKLMEAKKIIETKYEKSPDLIKKVTENYQKEIEEIENQVEKIKEKARENPKVENFLDKFIHQQTLHQKLLDRLETQVPPEAFEKIRKTRERHLERFKDVMLKLEDRPEKITEKLDKILEEQKGSEFKAFKNLEVLKNLEEKVPEETKKTIQKTREKMMERLQENLEKMTPEKQEQLKDYVEKISGDKETHLEIMENLKAKIKEAPPTSIRIELKEKLEEGKTKIFKKVEEKLGKMGCPAWTPPAPGFCEEGRIVIERDPETGCPLPPKCIVPGEVEIPEKPEVCPTLWDPVCGKDGKTYPNECLAKLAGVEMAHKGICDKEKEQKCAQAGEKVNRNPFLGPTNVLCCPGLWEDRVSRSYSICRKIEERKIDCQSDKDCQYLICPQVIGQDTSRCNLETNTCYCGPREEMLEMREEMLKMPEMPKRKKIFP